MNATPEQLATYNKQVRDRRQVQANRIAQSNAKFMFVLRVAGLTGLLIALAILGLCM